MKHIVFIETNFSGLEAIQYCHAKGYQTYLITDSLERFERWFPESDLKRLDLVSKIISISDSNNESEILQVISEQIKHVDAVITFAEIRTKITAKIAGQLGLSGTNPKAIETAQNKSVFRQVLAQHNVDTVWCKEIHSSSMLDIEKLKLDYPCFVKPIYGHSSIGAKICATPLEIAQVVKSLASTDEDCISTSVVAEEYLQGPLLSVEVLTKSAGIHEVVGIADREVLHGSIEIGASFPLQHPDATIIKQKACDALDAIGYDFGASHIELIMTSTGPHLVEINSRVGGSGHSIMLDLATNRSIVGDVVELYLGQLEEHSPLYEPSSGAAWQCFVTEMPGLIRKLPSFEEMIKNPQLHQIWYHHIEGDEISALNSNFNWIIQVMCTGDNQIQAKEHAKAAIAYVQENAIIK